MSDTRGTCEAPGCAALVHAKGLCSSHYKRQWYANNREHAQEYSRRWYAENREKALLTCKAWYSANKSQRMNSNKAWRAKNAKRVRAYNYRWRVENPDKQAEAVKRWGERNKDKRRDSFARRRARKSGARVHIFSRTEVYARTGGVCHICLAPVEFSSTWHSDHVVPLALGGLHVLDNLAPTHPGCNLSKGAKAPEIISQIPWVVSAARKAGA
jgi:hypothetical protein